MINRVVNIKGLEFAARSALSLIYKAKEQSYKHYRKLENCQWLSEEDTLQLQKARLEKIITHAYHHVPYYRKVLISAGVINKFNQINLDHFENIPLLDKNIIHDHFDDLKSDDLSSRKWFENASGGSTGQPVRLIQDKEYQNWMLAIKILYYRWTGGKSGDRKLLLWGSERDLFSEKETLKDRYGKWYRNEVCFNTFRMKPSNMHDCVNTINMFKPTLILSYVESIYELSRFIVRNRLEVSSPTAIMSTAGTLYPHFREKIERAFQAPIFNRYGSREVGDIACECDSHEGLHMSTPIHYVEILKENGERAKPGEAGEIVVTLLSNFAMPLIRYRIGDTGVWSEKSCSCGRNWPLMQQVTGRVTDTFVLKDGSRIDGGYFMELFYFRDWIQKFQVVQEDYDHIIFFIVPYKEGSDHYQKHSNELSEIRQKVNVVMGNSCKIEFKFVNDIKKTLSGKYRYVISKKAEPLFIF
jgi:phenylacetate-CoA ligase